jgi:NAD+ kinase
MKDVAVVYKYSALESYTPRQMRRHKEMNPELGVRMQQAHDDHISTFARLQKLLSDLGINPTLFERDSLRQNLDGFRLVISLGGDGTFINSSHFIETSLLLGINSSPENSVGHYCRFNLKNERSQAQLHRQLVALLEEKKPPVSETKLLRMSVTIQGRQIPFPILNDALICEENPAATSRYTIYQKNRVNHQKSSGVWITTPTGSTAAYQSAGGAPFKQREFRFIIRELYSDEGRRLKQGRVRPGESLRIVSSLMHGILYADGSHHKNPVALGDHVILTAHPKALRAIY